MAGWTSRSGRQGTRSTISASASPARGLRPRSGRSSGWRMTPTLYIVVRCYDSNMRGVRASQLRRDSDLSSDDNVRLLIDSFDDRRSAFVFATNPNGTLWDAQFSGVDDLNENWNGIWAVAVSRDSAAW